MGPLKKDLGLSMIELAKKSEVILMSIVIALKAAFFFSWINFGSAFT